MRTSKRILLTVLLLSTPADSALADCDGRPDGMCFIPDVPGQFRALARAADTLGFHITSTPNPSSCRHYQGLVRADAAADGTPFFMVTRSGNLPSTLPLGLNDLLCDDSPNEPHNGNLVVFRMASRSKTGERLRNNRLHKGVHVNQTAPPDEDEAAVFYTVVGGDPAAASVCNRPGLLFRDGSRDGCPSPLNHVLQHPGGMQRIGHMLAMAADTPRDVLRECHARCSLFEDSIVREACDDLCDRTVVYEVAPERSNVMFFDVSDPVHPVFKSRFVPRDANGDILHDADGLAVTPLANGLYLMAITAGFHSEDPIHFYRSTSKTLDDPNLAWEYLGARTGPNGAGEDAHQSLHFLREGGIGGDLYLAGSRGHPVFGNRDKIDLYRVICITPSPDGIGSPDPNCAPGDAISLPTRFRGQAIVAFPSTDGDRIANLAAAAGFYESPSGELLFYATRHDNEEPDDYVSAGEWRHQDVVRPNSPTLLPRANLDGPFEVDEGSAVDLTGTAEPPLTRAWIQLFSETDFGGVYPVVDYDDFALDDFDNFLVLELRFDLFGGLFSLNDKARSLNWYAPVGCSITAIDREPNSGIDETLTLTGTGATERYADLSTVMNDAGTDPIAREIDGVRFNPDCANYYATPVTLRWDLDRNGSYETTGTSVPFSAAAIDGPSVVQVGASAQHPAGGAPGTGAATVTVRNVSPQFTQFSVTNSAGQPIGSVPFVLTKTPVRVTAAFSDPGKLDHQTATVAWGDGATESNTAFTAFDEAFGDGVGSLAHTHRYPAAGDLTLSLIVRDDDGGQDIRTQSVKVVTPEQAVKDVIALLQARIASETNRVTKEILQKALKSLTGSPPDPAKNGALGMIAAGNNGSAIAFLKSAIEWLKAAQSRGANVALLISLLEQVILSLSAT